MGPTWVILRLRLAAARAPELCLENGPLAGVHRQCAGVGLRRPEGGLPSMVRRMAAGSFRGIGVVSETWKHHTG